MRHAKVRIYSPIHCGRTRSHSKVIKNNINAPSSFGQLAIQEMGSYHSWKKKEQRSLISNPLGQQG